MGWVTVVLRSGVMEAEGTSGGKVSRDEDDEAGT